MPLPTESVSTGKILTEVKTVHNPVFSSRFEEDMFWESIARYNPNYTPTYFDTHHVPVKALKQLIDLENDFCLGKICYSELDAAITRALFLTQIPELQQRFLATLRGAYLPPDIDQIIQELREKLHTPLKDLANTRLFMEHEDQEASFAGMHQEAVNNEQRALLVIIRRTFLAFRVNQSLTAEVLQACLVLAKTNAIPLTHLARAAVSSVAELTDPDKPAHPHFRQLLLWIQENLTPQQIQLIGFETTAAIFFPDGLTKTID